MSIVRIFPTENDVGGLTKGRAYSEANMKALIGKLVNHSFRVSGFTVTNPSGLTLRVAAGVAVVEGFVVEENANQDISASASQAGYHLWLVLRDTDTDGLVDDFAYQGTTNDTPPSGSTIVGTLLLAVAETGASTVTKLHTSIHGHPGCITGYYVGNNNDNRLIALPFRPKFVVVSHDNIYAMSSPGIVYANGFTYPLPPSGSSPPGLVTYWRGAGVPDAWNAWVTKTSLSSSERPECASGGFYVSHTGAVGVDSLNESALVYNYCAWS